MEALPEEDQKLYAEIIYSLLVTRTDHMVDSYNIDYLSCVITREPYDHRTFLFAPVDTSCPS